MSTAAITLPPIPPLPTGANWDQQMRHVEAQMAVLRFQQMERSIAATVESARVQDLMRQVVARQAAASERMLELMPAAPAPQAPAPQAPAPQAPASDDMDRMVALVSTMTSAQRQSPAAAASAAAAQLAAIRSQV